jgi:hypothetical protein
MGKSAWRSIPAGTDNIVEGIAEPMYGKEI